MEQFLPPNLSTQGQGVDQIINILHVLMLVLAVGWGAFFVYCLMRFRKSKNPTADYTGVKSHLSSWLEAAVALIEVVILVGLSIPIWSKVVVNVPTDRETVEVRVIAEQFKWNFHYPGPDGKLGRQDMKLVDNQANPIGLDADDPAAADDVVTSVLYMPVQKPIVTRITSKDVIHSFGIPVLRVKSDAIPGMETRVWFEASDVGQGEYTITCNQLCGLGHYRMTGKTVLMTPQDFDAWYAAESAKQMEERTSTEDTW